MFFNASDPDILKERKDKRERKKEKEKRKEKGKRKEGEKWGNVFPEKNASNSKGRAKRGRRNTPSMKRDGWVLHEVVPSRKRCDRQNQNTKQAKKRNNSIADVVHDTKREKHPK